MNPLMTMLIRNTRKMLRESYDDVDFSAPFVAVFNLKESAMATNNHSIITAAHFMAITAHLGDIP